MSAGGLGGIFSGLTGGAGGGLGLFGNILGGLAKGYGQYQQAQAQAAQQEAAANAFAANAQIAQINAQAAMDAGQKDKERRERIGRANLADKAVSYLNSGVLLTGTPLAVLGEEAANEALAAEDLLHDAKVRANQFNNQAILANYNAQQSRNKADAISGGAGASILGGLF